MIKLDFEAAYNYHDRDISIGGHDSDYFAGKSGVGFLGKGYELDVKGKYIMDDYTPVGNGAIREDSYSYGGSFLFKPIKYFDYKLNYDYLHDRDDDSYTEVINYDLTEMKNKAGVNLSKNLRVEYTRRDMDEKNNLTNSIRALNKKHEENTGLVITKC